MSGFEISGCMIGLLDRFDLGEIGTDDFVINFQKAWRQWRDSPDRASLNDRRLPEILDRAFTAADAFKPSSEKFRLASDLDERGLKLAIRKVMVDLRNL
jgi:Bacterial self-protective colicin-like immunity